jgi:hypothetical protein
MSRCLVTSGPHFFSTSAIIRLLAAGREMRTVVGRWTRAVEVHAMMDTRDVQPSARASFIAADRDHNAGRLDAVAGGEFVDDRIRLLE